MSTNLLREKTQLRTYLEKRGISYNKKKKTWRCPKHDDNSESAVLYENPEGSRLWCPVCNEYWDVFSLCGLLDNLPDFKDQLKSVRQTLGIPHEEKKRKSVPVPFPENKKQEFNEKIKSLEPEKGKITGSWKYEYPEGVMAIDVRYEKEGERKQVLTFWYDGKNLKWSGAPVLIYNLKEAMESDKPIFIHEGAKCSDKGKEEIQHFTHISWSGGSGKATQAEWSFCHGKEIYIYPDDDDAGIKAARKIYDKINGIANTTRIINPAQAGREIKKKVPILLKYSKFCLPKNSPPMRLTLLITWTFQIFARNKPQNILPKLPQIPAPGLFLSRSKFSAWVTAKRILSIVGDIISIINYRLFPGTDLMNWQT